MERKLIDCPTTEKREEIDIERTPFGVVIAGCSRFAPRCAVTCGGHCAAILDRRDRRDVDDLEPRVLVLYEDRDRSIAEALGAQLARDRLTVDIAAAGTGEPPPQDYDAAVLVVASAGARVLDYRQRNRDALAAMPVFQYVAGDLHDFAVRVAEAIPAPELVVTMQPARKRIATRR